MCTPRSARSSRSRSALTLVRLALQIPLSILPARIAADVQAQMRIRLFRRVYAARPGTVQSRDREGQLQETMTGQVMQARRAPQQATMLINSASRFSC